VLIHSWEGLSLKIRKAVRSEKFGKIKKITLDTARRFIGPEVLTNSQKIWGYDLFLKHLLEKGDVCFTTIRETAKNWVDGLPK
jgi:hypothetical protein